MTISEFYEGAKQHGCEDCFITLRDENNDLYNLEPDEIQIYADEVILN